MLTKKEIFDISYQKILDKFIYNGEFIHSNLKDFDLNSPVRNILNFNYTYGYSESFGYYFIAIDKKREGFIWLHYAYEDCGILTSITKVTSTTKYLNIENIIKDHLDFNKLRDFNIERFRVNSWSEIPCSENRIISNILFGNGRGLRKPQLSEMIGLLIIYYMSYNNNNYNKNFNENTLNLFRKITDSHRITNRNDFNFEYEINRFISKILIKDIKYMIEDNINIMSILSKLEKEVSLLSSF